MAGPMSDRAGEGITILRLPAAPAGHPCDVRFGREVGHVLAEAQRQIDVRAQ
jgi:hypothetical protein